jgi:hypothetical protein
MGLTLSQHLFILGFSAVFLVGTLGGLVYTLTRIARTLP